MRQQALPVAWNLGGTTWEPPAPQGAGVYVFYSRREVIKVIDDDTETVCTLWYVIHLITYKRESNV